MLNGISAIAIDARKFLIGFLCTAVLLATGAMASPQPARADMASPAGDVILTVSGKIVNTNDNGTARYDRKMLEALGMRTLRTSTPFETGVQQFEGILVRDLLADLGATGETLIAYALDGYAIEIPVRDVMTYPVILAMKRDGKAMTVRNKGPLWVIYPVDQYEELNQELFSSRSIWQLERIDIE